MNTKIDEKQLREFRRAGLSYKEIAAKLGVTVEEARSAFESLWDGSAESTDGTPVRYSMECEIEQADSVYDSASGTVTPVADLSGDWVRYEDYEKLHRAYETEVLRNRPHGDVVTRKDKSGQ